MTLLNFNASKSINEILNQSVAQARQSSPSKIAADVYTHEEGAEVWLELPGVAKSELNIEIEDGILKVAGSKPVWNHENTQKVFQERSSGDFERQFRISPDLDTENISATFVDGLLKVQFKKKAELKNKKIIIT